jgi:ParB family chromosome partitioning protein
MIRLATEQRRTEALLRRYLVVALKRGLGKGLSALLPDEQNESLLSTEEFAGLYPEPLVSADSLGAASETRVSRVLKSGEILIPLEKLIPNPNQARKSFDEEELAGMADSIRQQGIIQPIIAEDAGDGTFLITDGERRFRAARMAGLNEAPVILRKYSEEKRMEVSLVANIQRSDLNPIEEAAAYRQLIEESELSSGKPLSQDELAAKVGKNRATVANALRLLKLPPEIQEYIKKGELSAGHARAILSVADAKLQHELFHEIIKRGLSVREAEKRAAEYEASNGTSISDKKSKKKAVRSLSPELVDIEEKFITCLGTKVVINGDINKGSIMIDYYSMEDLDRLYSILSG